MNAILSGLAGKGLLIDGDKFYTISIDTSEIKPIQETSLHFFFGEQDKLSFLQDVTTEKALLKLQVLYQQQRALNLALILFDKNLSSQLRIRVAGVLEDLLSSSEVQSYLKAILYAKPLPPSADKMGVLEEAKEAVANKVWHLLDELINRQQQISLACQSWDVLPMDFFREDYSQMEVHSIAVESGLFAKLVENLVNDKLDQFQRDALNVLGSVAGHEKIINLWVQNLQVLNQQHVDILKKGIEIWNEWRKENPDIKPDLRGADLQKINLEKAILVNADLRGADLRGANLDGIISGTDRRKTLDRRRNDSLGASIRPKEDRRQEERRGMDLRGANLQGADLRGANLREANLIGAIFIEVDIDSTTNIVPEPQKNLAVLNLLKMGRTSELKEKLYGT